MRKYYSRRILNLRSTIVWVVALIGILSVQLVNATTRNAGTAAEFVSALSSSTTNDIINLTNDIVISSEQFINKNITINGNGYSISVPNPGLDDMGRFNTNASTFRVFTISSGFDVSINNATIKGGSITLGTGGAIMINSNAVLHLNNCIISNSRNSSSYSGGGGINNSGVLYLSNSMISRNAAPYGGGFLNSGKMYVENSTLSENRSTNTAGGGGAGENQGYLYINNSTLSNNQSTEIGGGINNYGGKIYISNSSVTGNVCYGRTLYKGGGIGNNNSGYVYAVNTLFAHNYHITSGSVTSPDSFELDDITAYSFQNRVFLYYCVFHDPLPTGTNDVIGNFQYTGLQDGSDNTIFSGGSLSKITDGTGTEIGTASIFRPFLYNNSGLVTPTIKIGSFLLQNERKGTQTRFSNNNNVLPALAYYNKATSTWIDLLNTSTAAQLVTSDQINAARANPPVVGAIETATTEDLYMVKINSDANGTVNGGTFFGDVYAAGTSTTITAIPNYNYHFVRWDYVGGVGGTGTASTANPYTFTINNDITLVPVFAENISSYYITYIGNENTSGEAPATESYTAPTTILPTGTLERIGYSIEGWNTNANGSGTDYSPGSTYSAGENLTLYAKWTKTTAITANNASNIRLSTASLGGTITPPEAVVLDRGICWKASTGVTISDHKTSEGGTSSGSFSVDVSNLTANSTIYYKAYFTTASGTTLSEEFSFSNIPVFTGTGYWDDAERWNVQEVPGFLYSPVIDGICTVDSRPDSPWFCNDLTINAGAKLIILPEQTFIVNGLITNNADAAGLVIQADPVLPNAAFRFYSGTPRATVEMYSKASWDLSQPAGSKYSWQFFGIPVKTLSYSSTFSNCYVRKYDETSVDDYGLWDMQSAGSTLTSGSGYEIVQQNAKKYVFVGELTNENFVRTLDYTANGVFAGQHILANPYTFAIAISWIGFGANTEQAIYLYNTGTYNQWSNPGNISYDDATTAAGQYTVSTPNTIGELGIPEQIPSMQGFLVKAMNEQGGSINIPYQGSIAISTDPQRVQRNEVVSQYDKVVSKIELKGSHYTDCVWIFTDPSCTRKFDNGWDGYKMKGSSSNLQLYATEADGDYQIDAVDDINETYLSFQPGRDTVFTLTFTHKNLESRYSGIYLVDLLTNNIVDVTANGTEYSFIAANTSEPVIRFKIITQATGLDSPEVNTMLKVVHLESAFVIQNSSNLSGSVKLFNLSGEIVSQKDFGSNGTTSLSTSGLSSGTYIMKAMTMNEKIIKKFIIR